MSNLYNRIEELCHKNNESVTTMCRESGASRASLSDLKVGRKQNLSAETLSKVAAHFGVSVDYLLGKETEKAPTETDERIDMSDVDVAFYGDYKELSDDDQKTIRDMVRVMRKRRAEQEAD
ncbi:MAG: helix-turn-helix transcriptional regulator [Oscillospiraceae bacterium]|nr:helix-turn-helix transcriptional regulator [Oscillospiraceae bacterium]